MTRRFLVFDERRGAFARVRNRRVLLYWPHGLGDFVHLGSIVRLLEPSNSYFLTRFGDDFIHLYDGSDLVKPLYSGLARIGDGSDFGTRHLGLNFKRLRNRDEEVRVPEPLASRIREAEIDTVLYTDYPDRAGSRAFPFHTKARSLARDLIAPERLAKFDLSRPLQQGIPFTVPASDVALIEARLRAYVGVGEHLYVIAPGGHTNARKVWPDDQVTRLAQRLRVRDPRARVLHIDERTARQIGHDPRSLPTIADIFGESGTADALDLPFAYILTTVVRASYALIGVPAGPLHLALSIGQRPIVGIWLAHHPDWYDEPCASATHLLGPHTYRKTFERRPASATLPASWRHRIVAFRDLSPTAEDVLNALDDAT